MKLRNLLFLYAQRVRAHPLQELLALLGIAVGVALVFAVLVANTSVSGSVQRLADGLAGSARLQVVGRGATGFDAALARRIDRLPGVRASAPVVEVRVSLLGPRAGKDGARRRLTAQLIGGDRRVGALDSPLLRELANEHVRVTGAVALPAPLADALGVTGGDDVRVAAGARTLTVPVATVLGDEQLGALVDSPVVLAPLDYAQRIGGLGGRVTRVLVVPQPGRAAEVRAGLERIAGDRLDVTTPDREQRLLARASAPNDQSTALFAGISALVGLLFAFNAMLLTVPERRRFIADLRLEGLGDLTVVRLVVFDALVLGIAASCAGLLLGDLLSLSVFQASPGYLSYAFTVGDQRIVAPRSVLIAALGGIAATLLAAMRPLGDLFSRRPLDDVLREDGERDEEAFVQRRWMLAAGAGLVGLASAMLLLAPSATVVGIVLLLGGMLLLIPGILAALLRLVDALSHRVHSPVLVVSIGELRATTTRSIALAATGALAVFGSVAVEGSHHDLQRGLDRDARDVSRQADVWIAPAGDQNVLMTTPFALAPRRLAALAAVDGVRRVQPYRGAFLDAGERRLWVVGPPAGGAAPVLDSQLLAGDLETVNARLRAGGWVALSDVVARELGLEAGDVVTLPTPRPLRVRLAAGLTNLGWSSGAIVVNAEDFARAWGDAAVSALQVELEPGASPRAARRALRAALGPAADGLAVQTAGEREQQLRTSTAQGLNRLTQIAALVLVAGALALAAAMGGVVWSRRPRLAALKLSGFSDGDVWRALVLESAIVLGIGCSVGALFGLYGQFMLTRWLREATGFPAAYATAGWLALLTFAGVTLVAVAIAALPGYLAARVEPTAASQHE